MAKRNATGRVMKKIANVGRTAAPQKPAASRARKKAGTAPKKRAAKKPAPPRKKPAAPRTVAKKAARRKTAVRAAASKSARGGSSRPRRSSPASGPVSAAAKKVRGAVAGIVQRVAGSRPWAGDEHDPIALLEADHRRFEDLLKQGEETTERAVKGRTALLDTLTALLNVHEMIEEQVLYPALKPHAEARDVVLEGVEEHHVADVIVKELHQIAKDNEQWGAKFKVLKESLEHHIEEEEHTMFPAARRVLDREALQEIGARMRALKADAEAGR